MHMSANLPPLSAIRAFEAASRHLSFTRAAEELGMTQAAISYQIKLLEERLGFPLFHRKARKIELTEKGIQLSPQIIAAFERLREAFEETRDLNARQLVVSSNTTFAMNWFSARIHKFQALNPNLIVRIIPYGPHALPEFVTADIAISACYAPPENWCRHEIVRARFTPMLSPLLAESVGGIKTPLDLLKLPIIDPHDPWWNAWFAEVGLPDVDLTHLPSSRMGSQALETTRAISGQGVAILTPYFCKTALETGQLIQPFDTIAEIEKESWFLSYPPPARHSQKVRLFRDWVFAELKADGLPVAAAEQSAPVTQGSAA